MIFVSGDNYQSIQYVADQDYRKGDVLKLPGFLIGTVFETSDDGQLLALVYYCNKAKAKKNPFTNFSQGERVYYDFANKEVNKNTSFPLVGFCLANSQAMDSELLIEFDGKLSIAGDNSSTLLHTIISITNQIPSGTILDGTISGVNYIKTGDDVNLKLTNEEFLENENIRIFISGMHATKGSEVIRVSSTEFTIYRTLDAGDEIILYSI